MQNITLNVKWIYIKGREGFIKIVLRVEVNFYFKDVGYLLLFTKM